MKTLVRAACLLTAGLAFLTVGSCGKSGTEVGRFARLELEASFPEPFSYLSGVRELSNGRILAADPLEQVLLSVDMESGNADTLGSVGGGPQEYQQPDRVLPLPSDSTLLVDLGNTRLTVIGPDGTLGQTLPLAQSTQSGRMRILLPRSTDDRGRIYFQGQSFDVGGVPDSAAVLRFDRATGSVDTVGSVRLPEMERSGSGGAMRMGPRPEADASAYTFPDVLPPFRGGRNLVSSSGDLWVERYLPEGFPPTYELFDARGVRMGEVYLPQGRRLIGFGDGTVYLVRVDDVDLRWLERYRVVAGRD